MKVSRNYFCFIIIITVLIQACDSRPNKQKHIDILNCKSISSIETNSAVVIVADDSRVSDFHRNIHFKDSLFWAESVRYNDSLFVNIFKNTGWNEYSIMILINLETMDYNGALRYINDIGDSVWYPVISSLSVNDLHRNPEQICGDFQIGPLQGYFKCEIIRNNMLWKERRLKNPDYSNVYKW